MMKGVLKAWEQHGGLLEAERGGFVRGMLDYWARNEAQWNPNVNSFKAEDIRKSVDARIAEVLAKDEPDYLFCEMLECLARECEACGTGVER